MREVIVHFYASAPDSYYKALYSFVKWRPIRVLTSKHSQVVGRVGELKSLCMTNPERINTLSRPDNGHEWKLKLLVLDIDNFPGENASDALHVPFSFRSLGSAPLERWVASCRRQRSTP